MYIEKYYYLENVHQQTYNNYSIEGPLYYECPGAERGVRRTYIADCPKPPVIVLCMQSCTYSSNKWGYSTLSLYDKDLQTYSLYAIVITFNSQIYPDSFPKLQTGSDWTASYDANTKQYTQCIPSIHGAYYNGNGYMTYWI